MTSSSEIYLKSEIRKVDLDSDTRYQKSRTLCHPRKPVSLIAANYVGTPSGIIYTKNTEKTAIMMVIMTATFVFYPQSPLSVVIYNHVTCCFQIFAFH